MAVMSKSHAVHHQPSPLPPEAWDHALDRSALDHATRLIHRVCCLAGEPDIIDEIRTDNGAIRSAIKDHDTPALFDWLMAMLSYQGISDQVAHDYMDQHGRVTWHDIERALANNPSCSKLQSYWQFHGCRYHKTSHTCAEPDHIAHCPLPTHTLRNGRLNQTAYSLYLFIRDVADMPASSTRGFRRPSRGSCSTRSGGTARRAGSTCATATASTTTPAATTSIAKFGPCVIASPCDEQLELVGCCRQGMARRRSAQLLLHFFAKLLPSRDPGPRCFLVDTLRQSGNAHSTNETAVNS
jgi:hypothetical protein